MAIRKTRSGSVRAKVVEFPRGDFCVFTYIKAIAFILINDAAPVIWRDALGFALLE